MEWLRIAGRNFRHDKTDPALIEKLMVRGLQLKQYLMRSGREAVQRDRLPARAHPHPRKIVDAHVQMPDPRRYGNRSGAEHRNGVQIFGAILDHDATELQGIGERRIDDELRRRFALQRLHWGRSDRVFCRLSQGWSGHSAGY